MKSDETRELCDRIQHSGDVRESDHDSGLGSQSVIIDSIEQSDGAVAAAYAPDGVYGRIGYGRVEVGKPLIIGAGKVAMACMGIFT